MYDIRTGDVAEDGKYVRAASFNKRGHLMVVERNETAGDLFAIRNDRYNVASGKFAFGLLKVFGEKATAGF